MLSERDLADLQRARELLGAPGWTIRLANQIGRPVEWAFERLPAPASRLVDKATKAAIEAGLKAALLTIDPRERAPPRDTLHRGAVAATGAMGGFFGVAALAAELPATTVLMLRSIADNARAQGEDLASVEARLNCLSVLGLGGRAKAGGPGETDYFKVRLVLARAVAEAAEYVAERGLAEAAASRGAPVIARLVATVSERFGVVVGEKVLLQVAPIVGAAGGAVTNLVFVSHFQKVALGHFTVRRLERVHGADEVRRAYEGLG